MSVKKGGMGRDWNWVQGLEGTVDQRAVSPVDIHVTGVMSKVEFPPG